jgi:hypothetical protein
VQWFVIDVVSSPFARPESLSSQQAIQSLLAQVPLSFTEDMDWLLTAPITTKELKCALLDMTKEKSLGLDSLVIEFMSYSGT